MKLLTNQVNNILTQTIEDLSQIRTSVDKAMRHRSIKWKYDVKDEQRSVAAHFDVLTRFRTNSSRRPVDVFTLCKREVWSKQPIGHKRLYFEHQSRI